MKTKRHQISKKNMPKGMKRITNKSGKRVWLINGKEYGTLAEVAAEFKVEYQWTSS